MRTTKLRATALAGAVCALCASALSSPCVAAEAADVPQRIPFQIATGSSTGTYFPVGALLSEVLSHPPGVTRCEAANACGPSGVIISTLASQGSVANVISVNTGMISSGLAQADVVSLAMDGRGPFRKTGPAKNLRVIADLYGEDLHLLAANRSRISSVADLRGKRVSLSPEGSGTAVTARAVLAAYGIPEKAIRPNFDSPEDAADLLREGKLDGLFLVGGVPSKVAQELIAGGVAHLVSLTGPGLKRLVKEDSYLDPHGIPKGAYGNSSEVETVSVDALWITGASEPENLIYGILKALYNPANRPTIQAARQGTHFVEASYGAKPAPAPPHPGAYRFFSEAGLMKPTAKALPDRAPGKKT